MPSAGISTEARMMSTRLIGQLNGGCLISRSREEPGPCCSAPKAAAAANSDRSNMPRAHPKFLRMPIPLLFEMTVRNSRHPARSCCRHERVDTPLSRSAFYAALIAGAEIFFYNPETATDQSCVPAGRLGLKKLELDCDWRFSALTFLTGRHNNTREINAHLICSGKAPMHARAGRALKAHGQKHRDQSQGARS